MDKNWFTLPSPRFSTRFLFETTRLVIIVFLIGSDLSPSSNIHSQPPFRASVPRLTLGTRLASPVRARLRRDAATQSPVSGRACPKESVRFGAQYDSTKSLTCCLGFPPRCRSWKRLATCRTCSRVRRRGLRWGMWLGRSLCRRASPTSHGSRRISHCG